MYRKVYGELSRIDGFITTSDRSLGDLAIIYIAKEIHELSIFTQKEVVITYGPERIGDVKHSEASIEKARNLLGYSPHYSFKKGLAETLEWYTENI